MNLTTEAKKWTGTELAEDLANHIQDVGKMMVWVEIPLGSVWDGAQRADVLAMPKSYHNLMVHIYEIKVSHADFIRDVNALKYAGYFNSCNYLYFACPSGLLKTEEIPAGCGLINRKENTWRVAKSPQRHEFTPDNKFLLKLLMNGYEFHEREHRSQRLEEMKEYTTLQQAYHDYGVKVGRDIANAQEIKAFAETVMVEAGKLFGKDYSKFGDALYDLKSEVDRLKAQHKGYRLAIPLCKLAEQLFNGDKSYTGVTYQLEELLRQAKKDWPEATKTID